VQEHDGAEDEAGAESHEGAKLFDSDDQRQFSRRMDCSQSGLEAVKREDGSGGYLPEYGKVTLRGFPQRPVFSS
jgi:hypothetical protein